MFERIDIGSETCDIDGEGSDDTQLRIRSPRIDHDRQHCDPP